MSEFSKCWCFSPEELFILECCSDLLTSRIFSFSPDEIPLHFDPLWGSWWSPRGYLGKSREFCLETKIFSSKTFWKTKIWNLRMLNTCWIFFVHIICTSLAKLECIHYTYIIRIFFLCFGKFNKSIGLCLVNILW